MSNYNPYTDFRTFTGKIDLMGEVVPVKSWFETYPNELCFYQETEPMPYPSVINHVATNHITPLDIHIICIVATLTFVTTKQINDCLTMLEIPHSETNVKSSVERLARHQMLRMSHFGVDVEHCCKFYVYSLNKNGADIDKPIRYKALFDNWASNSWGINNSPLLILNGENEEHNHQILALASDVGLENLYFTEDTLLCGSQFYHSIYQFHDNGQREFFCFDQPTIDVA